jgi:hypothetical protein
MNAAASSRVNLPAAWRWVNPIGPRVSRKSDLFQGRIRTPPGNQDCFRGRSPARPRAVPRVGSTAHAAATPPRPLQSRHRSVGAVARQPPASSRRSGAGSPTGTRGRELSRSRREPVVMLPPCQRRTSMSGSPSTTTTCGRNCSSPRSSNRASTCSRTWPEAARLSVRHRYGTHRSATQPTGSNGPRHRALDADDHPTASPGRCLERRCDPRRLRHGHRGWKLQPRLPPPQHDHEPDQPGRASRVLPKRRPTPPARRCVPDRELRPGAAAHPTRRDDTCLHRDANAHRSRRVRRRGSDRSIPTLVGDRWRAADLLLATPIRMAVRA